jgi:DNA gyrase inhibitor GyrI
MDVRLERLPAMRAAHVHVFSESPEEDAWRKMEAWAEPRGLLDEGVGTRIFGRNIYPTDEPEPYGYEFFLTIGPNVETGSEIEVVEVQGGLHAVLRFEDLDNMGEAWERMLDWREQVRPYRLAEGGARLVRRIRGEPDPAGEGSK